MKQQQYELTPLAAAVVEALPDQQRKRRVLREFEKLSVCPVSSVFDAQSVEKFYRDRGREVRAVERE